MKRILCLVFAFVLLFCTACKPNPDSGEQGGQQGNQNQTAAPVVEGKWVVKNGESEYSVLIPDSASSITQVAASEFTSFFREATGVDLKIKSNAEYSSSEKYISFGSTELSSSVTVSQEELNTQGFKIKTVGDNIVINAVGHHGLLWGAYELLTQMFDYEYFAKDVYRLDKDVKNLQLREYDIKDKPDIEVRAIADSQGYENSEVAHRLRQFQVYDEYLIPTGGNFYHNSFEYVADEDGSVPERFLANSGKQLCYSGKGDDAVVEEMLERCVNYLKEPIKNSELNDVIFCLQDEDGWCRCAKCSEYKVLYGTDSAVHILFMNRFRDKLDAWLAEEGITRTINLYWAAYFDVVQPPVEKNADGEYVAKDPSLVCKDGVGVLWAPIHSNFTQSIYNQVNETAYEQLKGMKAITKRLLVWLYACNFMDFLAPFDSFTYMQDWYQAIYENNGVYMFNQGRMSQGNSSQFDVLRQYLVAKIGWDVHADVEALTNDFFDVYFGKAKEPMRKMYDELRTMMRYNFDVLGMTSAVLGDVSNEKYWPVQTLTKWLNLIDQAYELAGNDTELNKRILRESIFVRYYYLKFYLTEGEGVEEMKEELISDALSVGIVRASEHRPMSEAFN